jgi:SAM-dependent methyltransferase
MVPEDELRICGHRVRVHTAEIGGRRYELVGPRDTDQLTDNERVRRRFEADEFMPYWAECWPASLLTAELVGGWEAADGGAAETAPVGSRRHGDAEHAARRRSKRRSLLELGCGLGLVSLVALERGFDVTACDYERDALAFVRENARRNGLPVPDLRYIDWRESYDDLRADRIVASDVLYETRNHRPIGEFVRRHLRPGGTAWIVDCYRQTADAFDSIARHCGLSLETIPLERTGQDGGEALRGRVFRLERKE